MKHLVQHSLGQKVPKPKHLKTFHAEEQHDGKFHVVRHGGNPKEAPMKHTANDLSEVHAALEDHMGMPNQGEEAPVPPAEGEPDEE